MIIHLKDIKSVLHDDRSTPAASDSALRRATRSAAQAFLALHWCLTFSDSVTQKTHSHMQLRRSASHKTRDGV